MGGGVSQEGQALAQFQKFDINHNGVITLPELIEVFQHLDPSWTSDQIQLLFNAADANRNGSISRQEFADWVMADSPNPRSFSGAAQEWRTAEVLEVYPARMSLNMLELLFFAGMWANKQVDDAQKSESAKRRVSDLHVAITDAGHLPPGVCTQLRDMALACSLIAVADLRLSGDGSSDAQKWLKKSMDPKPRRVSKGLWRATYDLCWASARYTCFLHLSDPAGQSEEIDSWIVAASTCFADARYDNSGLVKEMLLKLYSEWN